jgi:biotin carboxyl carrier protein
MEVRYRWERTGLALSVGETEVAARVHACGPDGVELEVDGVRRRYEVHRVDRVHYVDSPLGHSALAEVERFPSPEEAAGAGSLRAPLPGRVVRLRVRAGDAVEAGAVLAILEAMKMEHQVSSPHAGRVTAVLVDEGQTVEAGAVLAVVERAGLPSVPEHAT